MPTGLSAGSEASLGGADGGGLSPCLSPAALREALQTPRVGFRERVADVARRPPLSVVGPFGEPCAWSGWSPLAFSRVFGPPLVLPRRRARWP